MGGFLKWWVSPTNPWVFLLKMDHMGVFWGYHHLRKHPYWFAKNWSINPSAHFDPSESEFWAGFKGLNTTGKGIWSTREISVSAYRCAYNIQRGFSTRMAEKTPYCFGHLEAAQWTNHNNSNSLPSFWWVNAGFLQHQRRSRGVRLKPYSTGDGSSRDLVFSPMFHRRKPGRSPDQQPHLESSRCVGWS